MEGYMHTDGRILKLGKQAPKIDNRTLRLARYLAALPLPPPSCNWAKGVQSWGMMGNDQLGDCTCAAVGHGIQVTSLNSPEGEITPPDPLILSLYENSCGYVPGDPSTDQGGFIIDVLNYVRKHSLGNEKQHHHRKFKLYAYADPDPGNRTHIMQAVATFGVVDIGLGLPVTAQSQVGSLWDVVGNPQTDPNSQPGSWGGHSVVIAGYTPETLTCITWGTLQEMSWNFWATYVDEAHALLYHAWLEQFGAQFPEALAQLEADLLQVEN
jgi:hypothetical protein